MVLLFFRTNSKFHQPTMWSWACGALCLVAAAIVHLRGTAATGYSSHDRRDVTGHSGSVAHAVNIAVVRCRSYPCFLAGIYYCSSEVECSGSSRRGSGVGPSLHRLYKMRRGRVQKEFHIRTHDVAFGGAVVKLVSLAAGPDSATASTSCDRDTYPRPGVWCSVESIVSGNWTIHFPHTFKEISFDTRAALDVESVEFFRLNEHRYTYLLHLEVDGLGRYYGNRALVEACSPCCGAVAYPYSYTCMIEATATRRSGPLGTPACDAVVVAAATSIVGPLFVVYLALVASEQKHGNMFYQESLRKFTTFVDDAVGLMSMVSHDRASDASGKALGQKLNKVLKILKYYLDGTAFEASRMACGPSIKTEGGLAVDRAVSSSPAACFDDASSLDAVFQANNASVSDLDIERLTTCLCLTLPNYSAQNKMFATPDRESAKKLLQSLVSKFTSAPGLTVPAEDVALFTLAWLVSGERAPIMGIPSLRIDDPKEINFACNNLKPCQYSFGEMCTPQWRVGGDTHRLLCAAVGQALASPAPANDRATPKGESKPDLNLLPNVGGFTAVCLLPREDAAILVRHLISVGIASIPINFIRALNSCLRDENQLYDSTCYADNQSTSAALVRENLLRAPCDGKRDVRSSHNVKAALELLEEHFDGQNEQQEILTLWLATILEVCAPVSLACSEMPLGGWRAEVSILRDLVIEAIERAIHVARGIKVVTPSRHTYHYSTEIGTRGLFMQAYQGWSLLPGDEELNIDRMRDSHVPDLFWKCIRLLDAEEDMMVLSPPTKTFRVAFMSAFFREHSVGRLLRNVIKYIASHQQSMGDQFEIEVVLVHIRPNGLPSEARLMDPISTDLETSTSESVELPYDVDRAFLSLRQLELDMIVFADLYMDPIATMLATFRAATIQIAFWGHPFTSGSPTVDYFISSTSYEGYFSPAGACHSTATSESCLGQKFPPALTEPSASQLLYRELRRNHSCGLGSDDLEELSTKHLMRLWENSGDLLASEEGLRFRAFNHAKVYCNNFGLNGSASLIRGGHPICKALISSAINETSHTFAWWRRHFISGVYGVLQMPMKMHPLFDSAIVEILRLDPTGVVLVLRSKISDNQHQVRFLSRLRRTLIREGVNPYGVMLVHEQPKQIYESFLCGGVVSVQLDPFPFGGGVSLWDAAHCGVPFVTAPQLQTVHFLGAGISQKLHEWEFNYFRSRGKLYNHEISSISVHAQQSDHLDFKSIVRAYSNCAVFLAMLPFCRESNMESNVSERGGLCHHAKGAIESCTAHVIDMYNYELSLTNFSLKAKDTFIKSVMMPGNFGGNAVNSCGILDPVDYSLSVKREFEQCGAEWAALIVRFKRASDLDE